MSGADRAQPVENIPSLQGSVSALGSADAPFLYFENAPAFGTMNGIIKVTLTATRDMVLLNGQIASDHVVVAHMRMNVHAAKALKAALEGALLLASPSASDTPN
ncbi:MAG TPA: hypothetical protein VHX12_12470 [Acidisoma sp.]|jgi:hypothetical protein|nr:hypothetical protein [Acidisoma sp.]